MPKMTKTTKEPDPTTLRGALLLMAQALETLAAACPPDLKPRPRGARP